MELEPEVIEGVVWEDAMENRDADRDYIECDKGRAHFAAYLLRDYRGKRIRLTIEVIDG